MFSWLTPILSFLGGPIVSGLLDAYKQKLASETDIQKLRTDLASKEILLQTREAELETQYRIATIGKWYEPDKLMGYAVALYFAKLLVWDKVFALGSTDPLAGWASTTANLIVMFYFSKRGIENVVKIIKGK